MGHLRASRNRVRIGVGVNQGVQTAMPIIIPFIIAIEFENVTDIIAGHAPEFGFEQYCC